MSAIPVPRRDQRRRLRHLARRRHAARGRARRDGRGRGRHLAARRPAGVGRRGDRRATGAEAGWVTAGAAAGHDARRRRVHRGQGAAARSTRCPDAGGSPAEIIVQRGHRNAYDRTFRTAGARIVEVGYPLIEGVGLTYEWQLEAAFSERTVAVGHLALADDEGVPLRRVCELAAAHGVPGDRRRGGRAAAGVEPPPLRRRGRRARRVQRRQGDPRPAGLRHPRRAGAS